VSEAQGRFVGGWRLALLFVAFVLYLPVVSFGTLLWDDDVWLGDPLLEAPPGAALVRGWFEPFDGVVYPGMRASWWLERQLTGAALPWSHAIELVLFLGLIWLVSGLAARWFGRTPGVGIAVAVWALMPRHVESVAWLTGRKDLLSVTLVVAGIAVVGRQPARVLAGAGLVGAGVLVKPPVVLVAAALAALGVARGGLRWRDVGPALGVGAVAAVGCAVAAAGTPHHGLAAGDAVFGRALRLQGHWLLGCLGLSPPSAVYPEPAGSTLLVVGGLATAGWAVWVWRGPGEPSVRRALAALWWLPLLPYSGVVEMAFWGADRHLLAPSTGWVGAVALSLSGLHSRRPWLVRGLALGWVAWMALQTGVRVPAWRDDLSLWTAEQDRAGEHWARPFKLGMARARAGDFGAAAEALTASYRLRLHDDTAARLIVARVAASGWDAERHRVASQLVAAPQDAAGWMRISEELYGIGAKDEAAFAFLHCRARWGMACVPSGAP
jgi:hypothetical protein